MALDFDLAGFIEDMKACKPPYRCPFKDCGKVYKTFSGINGHIQSHDDNGNGAINDPAAKSTPFRKTSAAKDRSPSPVPFFKSPVKESLAYNEVFRLLIFNYILNEFLC